MEESWLAGVGGDMAGDKIGEEYGSLFVLFFSTSFEYLVCIFKVLL